MNATGRRRLLKLAAFLRQLPPQKFDFSLIAEEGKRPMLEALKARKEDCGTTACAIGWCPAVFPRLMRWKKPYSFSCALEVVLRNSRRKNFSAATKLFGISYREARYLFQPYDSELTDVASAKDVAAHIRAFVKRGGR